MKPSIINHQISVSYCKGDTTEDVKQARSLLGLPCPPLPREGV